MTYLLYIEQKKLVPVIAGLMEGLIMKVDKKEEIAQQELDRIERAIKSFGNTIKEYRQKEGLTLNALATRIGCSAAYMFRVEKGSRIVPVHMRIQILKKGLCWEDNEIEHYLVETVKKYERSIGKQE